MIKAVIFDMDGVVTDSERLGFEALIEAGRAQKIDISHDFIASTMGMTFDRSHGMYMKNFPGLDYEKLMRFYYDYMADLAAKGRVPLMKGVREMLDALDEKKLPRALASSSRGEIVRAYLESNGIYERFTRIISGEMCSHSKPDPEIFLTAAKALDVKPEYCLVLEDSFNGVRAGRAAGMQVCMIPDMVPYGEKFAPYVDEVAQSLLDARRLV